MSFSNTKGTNPLSEKKTRKNLTITEGLGAWQYHLVKERRKVTDGCHLTGCEFERISTNKAKDECN